MQFLFSIVHQKVSKRVFKKYDLGFMAQGGLFSLLSVKEENIQELPALLPVMILPGVTLFPNALLPLFIFEPRYRAMLEDALGAGRMLALAMPQEETESVMKPIAGAGLVRACIRNSDGTSKLILQGVSRVRFLDWEQEKPYPIARIEPLPSVIRGDFEQESEAMAAQLTQLHALCARFKEQGMELPEQFESYLSQITNVGVITDLVASTLVVDSVIRQELLEELDISKRLSKLLAGLRAQLF